jgi:hypothetical protein
MIFIELQHEAELPEHKKYNLLTSIGVTLMLENQKLTQKSASRNGANHVYKIIFIFCQYIIGSMSVTFTVISCSSLLCSEMGLSVR